MSFIFLRRLLFVLFFTGIFSVVYFFNKETTHESAHLFVDEYAVRSQIFEHVLKVQPTSLDQMNFLAQNHFLSSFIKKIDFLLPVISVFAIVLVIAIVVALNTKSIATLGLVLPLAIIIHNATGLSIGYWACKALGFDKKTCRTISIEVGLQNSGLAVALAHKFFLPVAALPGAIFSIWHNISGSILAGYWSKKS